MALIKTIAEVRAVVPRMSKLSDQANLPNMDKAAWKYIIPIIGQALYDDLNTKYNATSPTLSAIEQRLINLIQLPLANGALYDELPFMHTMITDNGIRTPDVNNMRASQRWEYQYLKKGLYANIEEGQEMLLAYLFENKDNISLWTTSDPYQRLSSLVFRSAWDFDQQYKLRQPMRTFWAMESIMVDVEEHYLASRLGRDLMNWIKAQTEIIVTENGASVDVKRFVLKAAALFTIKMACEQRQVIFDHWGFTMATADDADVPAVESMTDMDIRGVYNKKEAANRDGQNYLSKAAYYLKGIANGEFSEEFGVEFDTAFSLSPLYVAPGVIQEYMTNGNERRKGVFRLGS